METSRIEEIEREGTDAVGQCPVKESWTTESVSANQSSKGTGCMSVSLLSQLETTLFVRLDDMAIDPIKKDPHVM